MGPQGRRTDPRSRSEARAGQPAAPDSGARGRRCRRPLLPPRPSRRHPRSRLTDSRHRFARLERAPRSDPDAEGPFKVWTKRFGRNPRLRAAAAPRRPGRDARVLRGARTLPGRRGHRVHLLRPARLGVLRPAEGRVALDDRALRGRGRAVRQSLGADEDDFYLLGHSWAASSRPSTRSRTRTAQGPRDLQHDDEHPRLQPLRERGARAAAWIRRSSRRSRSSSGRASTRARATWSCCCRLLRQAHLPARRVARRGACAPSQAQRAGLRADAGPERVRRLGRLEKWDRKADLGRITVPTLVVGAAHATMDPEHMRWVSTQ